ncbi:MAG: aminopeptidase P family protein [Acidobacteriota bacterium]
MNAQTYAVRRRTLREALPDGAILILANAEAPKNYTDNVYPFRQDSNFLYYVGVNEAGMAALLLPDGEEILFGREEHPDDLVWHGPHAVLSDHASASAFAGTALRKTLTSVVADLRAKGVEIHYLPPYRAERRFELAEILDTDPRSVDGGVSQTLIKAVIAQREIKSDAEIAEIEGALAVTAEAYREVMAATRPGRTEAELAAVLQRVALAHDRQQSFNPIVSVRGEVLHNTSYGNTLTDGDLLLVDSGADSALWYASDITRTFPVSGTFTSQQRDVYEIVLAMQEAAIKAASPKKTNRELHMLAALTAARGLVDFGLMQGDPQAAVEAGAHALFFPHGLGHMLGQDVHDMEDLGDLVGYDEGDRRSEQFGLAFLRLAKKLEAGFVITIEPGIYFVPALIDQWQAAGRHSEFIRYDRLEAYQGCGGIRIEDDVLITEVGARVLGPGIPKTVAELEAVVGR